MKDENTKKFYSIVLEKIADSLKKNNFDTIVLQDVNSVKEYVLSLIGGGKTVGLGGSQTVRSLGIIDVLKENGNEIIIHTSDMSKEERIKIWLKAQNADFYLASPQAITYDGKLVFIDAYGNRVASIIIGPKKVILIAGYNKIVKDLDEAFWRIRNISAVMNNIRLNRPNPCVKTGKCEDCDSKTRICNVLTILYKKPDYTDYQIILVNEILGY